MPHSIIFSQTGSPHVLTMAEANVPEPGPGQVLVRNHSAAVNYVDTIIRRGAMPAGMMPPLPHVPGVEGAGVVEAVGVGVATISVGDRVAWLGRLGAGGYGSFSLVTEPHMAKLAPDSDLSLAAAMPVNAVTAWHMLVNLGHIRDGDMVLVRAAAGGVGTMIIQIAKHFGARVIAAMSSAKTTYASALGADHVIDHTTEDVANRVREITAGRGVDLALNPLSGKTLQEDLACLAPLGTGIVFGFLAGTPQGTFADLAGHFGKSIAVRLSDIYTYYNERPWDFRRDLENVLQLQQHDVLRPHVHKVLPLQDAALAHEMLETGVVMGKLVLSVG